MSNTIIGGDVGLLADQCGSADFISNHVSGARTGADIDDAYVVRRNVIRRNRGDGLVIGTAWDPDGVFSNDARGNGGLDCVLRNGPRPAGWTGNRGLDASPLGLCTPNGR